MDYDFSGWATKVNIKCSDGRTILKDAFKHNDGEKVPLVWMHKHDGVSNVLGHAILEHRDEGVYAYCKFNDTEDGQRAKMLVQHGDITKLSIYANQLKQQGTNVSHGNIRELSLVLAGANPEAFIDYVVKHSDDMDGEAIIGFTDEISLYHTDDEIDEEVVDEEEADEEVAEEVEETTEDDDLSHNDEENDLQAVFDTLNDEQKDLVYMLVGQALANKNDSEDGVAHSDETSDDETVEEVYETLTEKQKTVVNALIGLAVEDAKNNQSEGGKQEMKHNVFEGDTKMKNENVICHADQATILEEAKQCGSFKKALQNYIIDNKEELAHGGFVDADGNEAIEELFPEHELVKKGAPELIQNDHEWVMAVINKVHKSPISRIRTRQADARSAELRAKGYKKGDAKSEIGNIKLLNRTTDPQTIYIKDSMHRDDIIDITDFDVVAYKYDVMKAQMYEELAMAFMVGDRREEGEEDKISESHVRSIWNDDELYTIHVDVDYEAAKDELQGSNTGVNFGENYIKAEATITAALYAREQLKGKSNLDYFCTPHALNVMLLARDLNGRRIYDSKADLAKALNVDNIYTAEQFEGLTRTTEDGKTKKLVGLFVNLSQYHVGSTKGGQLTKFEQFDIDYNKYKYLLETRLSGASVAIKSAIALEEDVTDAE